MPSYAELETESAWREEVIPWGLNDLRARILNFFHWDQDAVGIRGNNLHTWGYHRSRRWILTSRFCTNRTASVIEDDGNKFGGDYNAVAGMDIVTEDAPGMYTRIANAKLAGLLPQLMQVILEFNPAHVHLSFNRARVNDDHSFLLALITDQENDMTPEQAAQLNLIETLVRSLGGRSLGEAQQTDTTTWSGMPAGPDGQPAQEPLLNVQRLKRLEVAVNKLTDTSAGITTLLENVVGLIEHLPGGSADTVGLVRRVVREELDRTGMIGR